MAGQPALSFAGLLRQLRAEARLTQEELAEAAGLSPRSISDLERGINRTARKDTALMLADALNLTGPAATLFVAAARGRIPAADVLAGREEMHSAAPAAAATRTLPRDVGSFTGRGPELARLMDVAADAAAGTGGGVVRIFVIGGMAGIGKTTFAVHAAHLVGPGFPDGQLFLPLHAHTPGQRPVDPADALESLLLTAGVSAQQIPPGAEARAARWRDHLAGKKILLLLDDAASHEQVRPLLPGTAGSLVLVTSRRHLTALDDAVAIGLDTLSPGEAADLLAVLASRPALRDHDAAAGEITRLCGYLPLAIGMLARQLHHHPAWTAEHVAADLAAARDRLELMQAENLSVAAAFDLSYQDLTGGQQRLFVSLGLHPGTEIDAYAAAALDGTSLNHARWNLAGLYDHHLITEPARGRYRLHDLIREHARRLAAADPGLAADRLLDYYLHTAATAGRQIATRTAAGSGPLPGRPPTWAPAISTPGQAAVWLETERPNLQAAVKYAAAHGRDQHAIAIPVAMSGFLVANGYWVQSAALHHTALAAARRAGDQPAQAGILDQLGNLRGLAGNHAAAAESHRQALALYRDLGDRGGQARALNHLGVAQAMAGDYPAAAVSQRQTLALSREIADQTGQADALNDLGFVQQLTGEYVIAAQSHRLALALYRDLGHAWGQADALNHLGIAQRLAGDHAAAAASQQQSLTRFCDIGHRRGQADALNELGLVQQLTGDHLAAAASHQQALEQYRDLGDRTGQAQALNNLGKLLSRSSASHQALDHYSEALVIARDIRAPAEEARALEGIGRHHLQDGNPGEGVEYLRQALAIYQRLGAPAARRLHETLHHHGSRPAPRPPASPASG